jgi:hypothetical protein
MLSIMLDKNMLAFAMTHIVDGGGDAVEHGFVSRVMATPCLPVLNRLFEKSLVYLIISVALVN